jgi:hypothetical protein
MAKFPDGHSETLDNIANTNPLDVGGTSIPIVFAATLGVIIVAKIAQNLQRHHESLKATFTFDGVKFKFASELDRLRNLSNKEYDAMMAEANERFAAKLHAYAAGPKSAEELVAIAQREAEDSATFGMEHTASQGEMSVEVTRSNSRKMLIVWGLVGVLSMMLLVCIASGVGGLIYWSRRPPAEAASKKQIVPAKEMKAKIKTIDRNQGTIRFLVGDGKYQTYRIGPGTEFRDESGQRLADGFDTPRLREDEFVTILPTDDQQGLHWVKLGR